MTSIGGPGAQYGSNQMNAAAPPKDPSVTDYANQIYDHSEKILQAVLSILNRMDGAGQTGKDTGEVRPLMPVTSLLKGAVENNHKIAEILVQLERKIF